MKMKKHHTTIVLLILFFTGLIVLWWADYAEIPTPQELREREGRVLPELAKIPPTEIRRLEIDRAKEKDRLVFERRDRGNWQMIEPVEVAADRSMVETLARNLTDLHKSPDAGPIEGSDSKYGLAPPDATVRVFVAQTKAPLATLEVGLTKGNLRYVREVGAPGIEVVDARRLNMLDRPAPQWRERSLFTLPTFRVGSLVVKGPGRDLKVERVEGKWTLLRPVRTLAREEKIEGVVAGLAALKVADDTKGFVADNVKDGAPYGLDTPTMTIELGPVTTLETPQTLLVGQPIPDHADQYYARRGDQDDVVAIELRDKDLRDLGTDPNALRSQKVADFDPGRAHFVRLEASEIAIELVKSSSGWQLVKPVRANADAPSVQSLLTRLDELQASAFLDPSQVADPQLDTPHLRLKVWQPGSGEKSTLEPGTEPKGEPRVNLRLGRSDPLRKVIFARVEGDRTVLALPETFRTVLPKNALAYRDRTMLSLSPSQLQRLTVRRGGTTYEVSAPGTASGSPTHWRLRAPVEANADDEAATKMVLILANLHAEELVSDQLGDGKAYGLDAPALTVTWTTSGATSPGADTAKPSTGTLRIGAQPPKAQSFSANLVGSPIVFTLSASAVAPFEAEFHDRGVLTFPADQVERLVLRWPDRTFSFTRPARPTGPAQWLPESGIDLSGFDLNKLNALVTSLSRLVTPQFVQYDGPFPSSSGLDHPQLTIEVVLGGQQGTRALRLGNFRAHDQLDATTATGSSGPVFVLTGPAWTELVKSPRPSHDFPDDVFAP
jgi:hypothetical protein